nr:hypothetical protein [Pseudanabaena yagii]
MVDVNFPLAVLFFVFDNQNWAVVAEEFDDVEPIVKVGVFFAGIGNEEIEGALGEEILMGGVIDFLSTKVPDIDVELLAIGAGK